MRVDDPDGTVSRISPAIPPAVVKPLLTPGDLDAIGRVLPAGSTHVRQPFRPEFALDPAVRIPQHGLRFRQP